MHFQICLVDSPRSPHRAGIALPTLCEFRDIALHPAQDGGMRHIYVPLRHDRYEVPVA